MEIIIKPRKDLSVEDFKEVWRYRELLYFFSWRDLKVRYKQTAIGVMWAIFQPFTTMVVFSVFFGRLVKVPSDGIPYPVFVYVGLLIWQFFSTSLSETSDCLISNQAIVTKVYFPRLILPFSIVITKFADFLAASVVMAGLMVYYRFSPHLLGFLILPVLLILSFMAASGLGLVLASINVKYRDVRYVLPFFIQSLLFLTPVIYPSSIAGRYAWVLALNPMTGVINTARSAFFGSGVIEWNSLLFSAIISIILFIAGILFFKKTERYFADVA